MSLYAADDERRIRAQGLVREWTKSGLLEPAQGEKLDAELRVGVRRTNNFLRAGLALFTGLVAAASVAFVAVVFDLNGELALGVLTGVSAVACVSLARILVTRQRFYRFGVEEALAVASVILAGISAAALSDAMNIVGRTRGPRVIAVLAATGGFLAVYRRFGYVYAAVAALACAAALPFQFDVSPAVQRGVAAVLLAVAFAVARAARSSSDDTYFGDDAALLQAAGWAGIYLTLNLQLTSARIDGAFYWFTYAVTWALPIGGLFMAIRDRERALLDVSLAMALGTLLTNKAYLGWPRHEWDPILLGLFLMAAGIGVRRWLAAGRDGHRAGFTPARILARESGAVTVLGTASAKFHPQDPSFPDTPDDGFQGGRSGGAGASRTY